MDRLSISRAFLVTTTFALGTTACTYLIPAPDYAPIYLASGPVKDLNEIPKPAAPPVTVNDAIALVNLQSNSWLAQLHSPALKYLPDTIHETEGLNEFYQVAAVLIPVIAPYATGLLSWQKLIVAAVGGLVGYKTSKGSAVVQNQECLDLNKVVLKIQAFDAKWVQRFEIAGSGTVLAAGTKNAPAIATAFAPGAGTSTGRINNLILTVYSQMVSDEDEVSAAVAGVANNCMNPYIGAAPPGASTKVAAASATTTKGPSAATGEGLPVVPVPVPAAATDP